MVPAKKASRKVQRDEEKIAVTTVTHRETLPTPVFQKETKVTAMDLLNRAPPVPYISKIEDAVTFVDKYERWMRDVKSYLKK